MPNSYVTLAKFKQTGVLSTSDTATDPRLLQLIENTARQIDEYCGRHFFPYKDVLYFSGRETQPIQYPVELQAAYSLGFIPLKGMDNALLPDDVISIDSLYEDTQENMTYPTLWSPTDYILLSNNQMSVFNAHPLGPIDIAEPWTRIAVNKNGNGHYTVFKYSQKAYKITGTFGFCNCTTKTGCKLNAGINDSVLTFVTDVLGLEVGMTVKIDSEDMYVTAYDSGTKTATVTRPMNGSTAAAHLISADIYVYQYPASVIEATIMHAGRLWGRRTSMYMSQVGFGESGQLIPISGLDQDVKDKLKLVRKRTKVHQMRVLTN